MHTPLTAPIAVAMAGDSGPPPLGRTRLFDDGFLHASSGSNARSQRHSASLLISLNDSPLQLDAGGQPWRARVLAVGPSVPKVLHARHHPFACIDAEAVHPLFRAFAALPLPKVLELPHEPFVPAMASLDLFRRGEMNTPRASRLLFRRVIEIVRGLLPVPAPIDARVRRVMNLLDENPLLGVAELAGAVHLSRDRLSHLFSEEMGLPLRKYSQSLKLRAAARLLGSGLNFTQMAAAAGFTDSAHFSKTWAQAYGASPAHFAAGGEVLIYPPLPPRGEGVRSPSSRLRSRNAANSQERMPTTKV